MTIMAEARIKYCVLAIKAERPEDALVKMMASLTSGEQLSEEEMALISESYCDWIASKMASYGVLLSMGKKNPEDDDVNLKMYRGRIRREIKSVTNYLEKACNKVLHSPELDDRAFKSYSQLAAQCREFKSEIGDCDDEPVIIGQENPLSVAKLAFEAGRYREALQLLLKGILTSSNHQGLIELLSRFFREAIQTRVRSLNLLDKYTTEGDEATKAYHDLLTRIKSEIVVLCNATVAVLDSLEDSDEVREVRDMVQPFLDSFGTKNKEDEKKNAVAETSNPTPDDVPINPAPENFPIKGFHKFTPKAKGKKVAEKLTPNLTEEERINNIIKRNAARELVKPNLLQWYNTMRNKFDDLLKRL